MVDVHAGRFDARRAEAHLDAARKVFEAGGDDVGLAWAGFLEAHMRWMRGHAALAATAALQAEAHARAAGDDPLAASDAELGIDGTVLRPGLRRRSPGRGAGPAGRRERAWSPAPTPSVFVGKLLAMRGDQDAARELVRAGVESSREAGQLIEAAGGAQTVAFVELRAGAPESAEEVLRASIAELDRLGNLELPRNDVL